MEWVIKIIRLWPDFSKVAKHGLRNFLDETVFFWQVAIVLTCFQSEKSQNKLYLMQNVLIKRFTKLVKINFRGNEAEKSHLSNFPFSFCLNLYQITVLHLVKTFRIKTFKKNIKNCHKSMQSWTKYQFRFETGSWCIAEYYLPNSDDYILHNKMIPI